MKHTESELSISDKYGDNCVIVDSKGNELFVICPIDTEIRNKEEFWVSGVITKANAKALVQRWNAFEKDGPVDKLTEACHNLAETMGIDYAIKVLAAINEDTMAIGASIILKGIQRQAKEAEAAIKLPKCI